MAEGIDLMQSHKKVPAITMDLVFAIMWNSIKMDEDLRLPIIF